MLRLAVPDFDRTKRGPGATRGPRMHDSSWAGSVPFEQARRLLAVEMVVEGECECRHARRPDGRDRQHDAHAVLDKAAVMASQTYGLDGQDRLDGLGLDDGSYGGFGID